MGCCGFDVGRWFYAAAHRLRHWAQAVFDDVGECLQAAQLGIIFAAVSELATDQTIMQQLSDPNSNSQAYFLATTFLATAATFVPRFIGGEQPEDREQGVWTVTAELANGRVCSCCLLLVKCAIECTVAGHSGVYITPAQGGLLCSTQYSWL